MKISLILVGGLLATTCLAQVQSGLAKPKSKAPAKAVNMQAPVTQAEARAVFNRLAKVVSPVIKVNLGASPVPSAATPVTRATVVAEFTRLMEASRPAFKYTPRKVRFDRERLTLSDAVQRPRLEKLIEFGAVAKVGPLAAGDKPTLTISEFGDAVGFFLSRLAEVTYMPSSKWTPALQP